MKHNHNKSIFLIFLATSLIFAACSKKSISTSGISDTEKSLADFSMQKISLGKDKIEFDCSVDSEKNIRIPLELYCAAYKIEYEVCGRCGHTKIFLTRQSEGETQTDVMQAEWNSPYISYANKEERHSLNCRTINLNGITWASIEILNYFDF